MRKGLYANIHAKRKRGEKMRKKEPKGAPTSANFKRAAQTVRKKQGRKTIMKDKIINYWNGMNKKGKILAIAIVVAIAAGIIWS